MALVNNWVSTLCLTSSSVGAVALKKAVKNTLVFEVLRFSIIYGGVFPYDIQ